MLQVWRAHLALQDTADVHETGGACTSAKMYLTCAFVGDGGRSQNRAKHVQIYFIRPRILYVVGGGPRPWADNRNPRESARDLADLGRLVRLALS